LVLEFTRAVATSPLIGIQDIKILVNVPDTEKAMGFAYTAMT